MPENPRPEYSVRLRSLMEKAALSQEAVATAIGTTQAAVSTWLVMGKVPHKRTLDRLCSMLGVRAEWLVDGIGPKAAKPGEDPLESVPPGLRDDLATLARAAQENPDAKAIITHAARLFRRN